MNTRLNIDIAWALLLARWKQTLVAAIGVMFSITMFITLLGFMTGLNDMLDGLVLNRTPHIRLYNNIKPRPDQPIHLSTIHQQQYNFIHSVKSNGSRQELRNSRAIMQALQKDNRLFGFTPRAAAQVFFHEGAVDITGMVNGIEVVSENRLFHFSDYIIGGTATDLTKIPNSIILGKALADQLLVHTGDVIQVTTAGGERFPLTLVGLFQSGLQEFDKTISFASLLTVQKMLGRPGAYVTEIHVKLNDIRLAPAMAKEYAHLFTIDAEDIQTANAQFDTGNFIRTLISYTVGITLLVVAGFGIYNILNMMIYEKMDSIAILKATGFSGSDVKEIFLVIAVGIGLFGGITGLAFGYLCSLLIDQIPFTTDALPTITTYPVNYNPVYYLIGILFSLITTYFAGWFPSAKASKVDPVVIIRGK